MFVIPARSLWLCLFLLASPASALSECNPEDDECLASVSLLQQKVEVRSRPIKEHADRHAHIQIAKVEQTPLFTDETMPAVSTTLKCIMNLTYQYFGLFTALAIVRTLISFKYDLVGIQRILETGCATVTYAPMLCVLFLGTRMRALQLTQGDTEKYQLPQPWVQNAMIACSGAVLLQVVLVLLVGILSGVSEVTTDSEGNLDTSKMKDANPIAVNVLTAARYAVMAMLYGGFAVVVAGVFKMEGPEEIWHGQAPPVSPAVQCTIWLTGMFFLIYLLVAVTKTLFEVAPGMRISPTLQKLEASAGAAKMTVNFAPMLAILFVGTRMRALQIDPLHGNPQPWAQKCFFLCTFSVLIQALLALILPFATNAECKRGACEGDVSFAMENKTIGMVMELVRYTCLFALYGGVIAVVYSVLTIEHPDGPSKTPPVSPAMKCTLSLSVQYFFIYSVLFACITVKTFVLDLGSSDTMVAKGVTKAIVIFDAARSTVMFAPMLSILCFGCRMRSLQLAMGSNHLVPPTAGPQIWAQQAMQLSTGAVFIQLVMTIVVPVLTGVDKPELDVDGNVKTPSNANKYLAMFVEFVRYMNLIFMYIGATIVCVGVVMMTPNTVQPYAKTGLIPGGPQL